VPLDETDTTVTAYCGQRVTQWAHSETPTCPGCAAALARSTRPDVFAAGLAQLTAERHARDIGAMQATAAKLGVVGTLETALRTSDRHLCRILIENALMLLKGR
jgi:hypothetical protein